ncbi:hypothetical protein F6V25_05170 [Oryzomonas japonica]|uniref:Uncharacterized protein n=1 Tax=Oryzomonas japonica TaxID=2603858 RepID=A0A7J4ZU92_9BACT|nr:hypothetical protein [Oryzomonas japonica]KAB0666807.1 hypothetical protein F6V25_05170 [Oryzomonas japonica]
MRKFIISVLLIVTLATSSNAFFPLAFPAIPTALYYVSAGAHAALLAGLAYYMTAGASSQVSASGSISRPSNAAWIDLTASPPALNTKSLSANMSYSDLIALSADKSKYPLTNSALYQVPDCSPKVSSKVGDVISTPSGYHTVTGILFSSSISNTYANITTFISPYDVEVTGAKDSYAKGLALDVRFSYGSPVAPTPPSQPATPAQVSQRLAAAGVPGPVKSALQSELDNMFRDPNYVPTFTDDTTGLPDIPPDPSHVATPAQVATYNANGQAAASAQAAASSSGAAASSAQGSADNAKNAYIASGGDPATGAGGDPSLYQKYLDAKSSADKAAADAAAAQAAADKLAAEQTKDANVTAPGVPADNTYNTDVTAPDKKDIKSLLSSLLSSSPLVSMVKSFTITATGDPVIHIGMVYGQDLSFDFNRYTSTFSALGGIFLIICHGFAILVIFKGW